jgi:hypothetical protein
VLPRIPPSRRQAAPPGRRQRHHRPLNCLAQPPALASHATDSRLVHLLSSRTQLASCRFLSKFFPRQMIIQPDSSNSTPPLRKKNDFPHV